MNKIRVTTFKYGYNFGNFELTRDNTGYKGSINNVSKWLTNSRDGILNNRSANAIVTSAVFVLQIFNNV